MQPGRYRHKLTIEEKETIDDPHGSYAEWNEIKQVWGRVTEVDLDGREQYDQIGYPDVSKKINFAYPVDIKFDKHRIKYKNKTYEIVEPLSSDQTGRLSSIVVRRVPQED